MTAPRPVSLTGIKPTGTPHLGNLLGAIRPALELTKSYEGIYFIADYHALTTLTDGKEMMERTIEVAATWLALGLDPETALFFKQSDVPEVCELAWILACFTPVGVLNRAHAYKDALAKGVDPNTGLFIYPVLMAADILLYRADVVPVGKDQKQHLEIARDIAQRVNMTYGDELLVVPAPSIQEDVAVIPGLDGEKMSKSKGNTIEIFLEPKDLEKKLKKIVTGSEPLEAPKDPKKCNVFTLFELIASPAESAELARRYRAGGMGYGESKKRLFEVYEAFIAPRRAQYRELMADKAQVLAILERGAARARLRALATLEPIRRRCGFRA
jgi:tryptophanyl-tRNA synthetase